MLGPLNFGNSHTGIPDMVESILRLPSIYIIPIAGPTVHKLDLHWAVRSAREYSAIEWYWALWLCGVQYLKATESAFWPGDFEVQTIHNVLFEA